MRAVTERHTNVTHVIPKLIYESNNGKVIGQKRIFEKKNISDENVFRKNLEHFLKKKMHEKKKFVLKSSETSVQFFS